MPNRGGRALRSENMTASLLAASMTFSRDSRWIHTAGSIFLYASILLKIASTTAVGERPSLYALRKLGIVRSPSNVGGVGGGVEKFPRVGFGRGTSTSRSGCKLPMN